MAVSVSWYWYMPDRANLTLNALDFGWEDITSTLVNFRGWGSESGNPWWIMVVGYEFRVETQNDQSKMTTKSLDN